MEYLKDWRIWLIAFAIFIICELTYGCAGIKWDYGKGVRYDRYVGNGWYLTVKGGTNFNDDHIVYGYFHTTFNMEDVLF